MRHVGRYSFELDGGAVLMRQMIFRIVDTMPDAEVLDYDNVSKQEYFKSVNINDLISKLEDYIESDYSKKNIMMFDDNVIGAGKNHILIKQDEHKRIVTYQKKAYNITFPNSLYIMHVVEKKIKDIEAYIYKQYDGKQTKLYKYAMPNMLTSNRICMGSAPKEVENDEYVKALEKILFTQYTHSHVDNIKSFKNTVNYFEYLEKNKFPYDLLIPLNKKLKDVLK